MSEVEFKKICSASGYADKKTVEKYISKVGKTEFTQDDLIEVYRIKQCENYHSNPCFHDYQGTKSTKRFEHNDYI